MSHNSGEHNMYKEPVTKLSKGKKPLIMGAVSVQIWKLVVTPHYEYGSFVDPRIKDRVASTSHIALNRCKEPSLAMVGTPHGHSRCVDSRTPGQPSEITLYTQL